MQTSPPEITLLPSEVVTLRRRVAHLEETLHDQTERLAAMEEAIQRELEIKILRIVHDKGQVASERDRITIVNAQDELSSANRARDVLREEARQLRLQLEYVTNENETLRNLVDIKSQELSSLRIEFLEALSGHAARGAELDMAIKHIQTLLKDQNSLDHIRAPPPPPVHKEIRVEKVERLTPVVKSVQFVSLPDAEPEPVKIEKKEEKPEEEQKKKKVHNSKEPKLDLQQEKPDGDDHNDNNNNEDESVWDKIRSIFNRD